MDTRTLRYCVALSQELNFTTVARKSHITQQALSQQIISLERELGYLIFNRNNRSMEVTPAGEVFIEGVRNALDTIDKAIESGSNYSKGMRGMLSITYTGSFEQFVIIKAINEYNSIAPSITIDIRQGFYEDALDMLNNKVTDLICVTYFGALQLSEKYGCEKIPSGVYKVVISDSHLYAGKAAISKEELLKEPLILAGHKKNEIIQNSMLDDIRSVLGELPKTILYAHDTTSKNAMVEAGMGYTFIPSKLENHVFSRGLLIKEIDSLSKNTYSQFVWLRDNNAPYLKDFVKIAAAV
jgi:DNA-binding transcriptional LysR family regulator